MAMMLSSWARPLTRWVMTGSCLLVSLDAAAQDRSVVFLHGLKGSSGTWAGAAERLETRLAIRPEVPVTSWQSTFENQVATVQSQLHALPASTVAVGHSNGGIVARQWSRSHELSGVVTVGTPHRGAPILDNLGTYAFFNYQLMSTIVNVYHAFAAGCCNWYFLLSNYHLYWSLAHDLADASLREVATSLGVPMVAPVVSQMAVASPFIGALNSPDSLAREASAIPARIGIV